MGEEGEQGDGGQDSTVGERGGDFEGRCDPGAIEEEDINGLVLLLTTTPFPPFESSVKRNTDTFLFIPLFYGLQHRVCL